MKRLLRVFTSRARATPVTIHDVDPAPQDPIKEEEARKSTEQLVGSLLAAGRSSFAVRVALVEGALNIVTSPGAR
jgi:hypothetical protein